MKLYEAVMFYSNWHGVCIMTGDPKDASTQECLFDGDQDDIPQNYLQLECFEHGYCRTLDKTVYFVKMQWTIRQIVQNDPEFDGNLRIELGDPEKLWDCMKEELFEGNVKDIPEDLLDYEVLETGWLIGAQMVCVTCQKPEKKEDPVSAPTPADVIKEAAAASKNNLEELGSLYDLMLERFKETYVTLKNCSGEDADYIHGMLSGLKHVLPRMLGFVLEYKVSFWPENVAFQIKSEIDDFLEELQSDDSDYNIDPLPGAQSIYDDYIDMLRYLIGESEKSDAWYMYDTNHALLDYFTD